MKKIVIVESHAVNPGDLSWDSFKELGDVVVYDRTTLDELDERIKDTEYIFVNKLTISEKILDKHSKLKFIGVLATGFNNIDTKACALRDIVVCNVPSYGTDAVAQHVFALLLEICNHVFEHSQSVFSGQWARSTDFCYWNHDIMDLSGKTLGIIGFGTIGKAVSKIALAFNMNVIYYSLHKHPDFESDKCIGVSLDELYEESDIITLHCPLTAETKEMINNATLAKMKPSVILINTSRGGLIAEEDLKEALNSDRIFYAAADVVSEEPIKISNPLLSAKNILITPHIAWASKESRMRLINIAKENLKAYIEGNPINVVNYF